MPILLDAWTIVVDHQAGTGSKRWLLGDKPFIRNDVLTAPSRHGAFALGGLQTYIPYSRGQAIFQGSTCNLCSWPIHRTKTKHRQRGRLVSLCYPLSRAQWLLSPSRDLQESLCALKT